MLLSGPTTIGVVLFLLLLFLRSREFGSELLIRVFIIIDHIVGW
jgi:hypothetical protein